MSIVRNLPRSIWQRTRWHIVNTSLACISIGIWGRAPDCRGVLLRAHGQSGARPIFATCRRGGGTHVPWVGEFGGDVNGM